MSKNPRVYKLKSKRVSYTDYDTFIDPKITDTPPLPHTPTSPETSPEELRQSSIATSQPSSQPSLQSNSPSDKEPVIQESEDTEDYPSEKTIDDLKENAFNYDASYLPVDTDEYNTLLESIPQPDKWIISLPTEKGLPHLLNFIKGTELIAVLPLTDENIETLIPTLRKYYTEPNVEQIPLYKRFINGWKKHKIMGSFGILIGVIVIVNIVASIAINGLW